MLAILIRDLRPARNASVLLVFIGGSHYPYPNGHGSLSSILGASTSEKFQPFAPCAYRCIPSDYCDRRLFCGDFSRESQQNWITPAEWIGTRRALVRHLLRLQSERTARVHGGARCSRTLDCARRGFFRGHVGHRRLALGCAESNLKHTPTAASRISTKSVTIDRS